MRTPSHYHSLGILACTSEKNSGFAMGGTEYQEPNFEPGSEPDAGEPGNEPDVGEPGNEPTVSQIPRQQKRQIF